MFQLEAEDGRSVTLGGTLDVWTALADNAAILKDSPLLSALALLDGEPLLDADLAALGAEAAALAGVEISADLRAVLDGVLELANGGGDAEEEKGAAERLLDAFHNAFKEQSRVPAGSPEGGQFGSGDGGGSGDTTGTWTTPAAQAFIAARDRSTRSGFLAPITPEDMAGKQLFVSSDSKVGFALANGDIENLFNNGGPKGAACDAIADAIGRGGRTLDCYDGFLPGLYSQFGFEETGRMTFNPAFAPPHWDQTAYNSPDVVFMAWTGYKEESPDVVTARAKDKQRWRAHTESARRYTADDWDAAKEDSRGAVDPGPRGAGKGAATDRAGSRPLSGTSARSRRAVNLSDENARLIDP